MRYSMEQKLELDGHIFDAVQIPLQGASLLLISGQNGFLGCGYINMETAERLGAAFALVTGVSSFEDMLKREVKAVSSAAAAKGVKPGMSGRDALLLLV
ncbi:MAG: DUF1805 domain-containing protein [Lentisphaeria bacterium]|nr:DUF1805 domain-containing protein [Lentisphaeria bacterium]